MAGWHFFHKNTFLRKQNTRYEDWIPAVPAMKMTRIMIKI